MREESTLPRLKIPLRIAFILLAATDSCPAGHRLDVKVRPLFGSAPLEFDTLSLEGGGGKISITRSDLLLSSASVQKEDGTWISSDKWSAYVGMRAGRNDFALTGIPEGRYKALRFLVGLTAETNHADPALHAPGHPLNPLVNGMHWSWQGGYVFAAIEGRWSGTGGKIGGFSYHLANDGNHVPVVLPVALDLISDSTLRLDFDASRIFENLVITDATSNSHSREGDPMVDVLKNRLRTAFRVEGVSSTPTRTEIAVTRETLIAEGAMPYRFIYPAGFPRPALPVDNPLTEEGVELGRSLFHDTRLSGNNRQSCSDCHRPQDAFSDRRRVSLGAFGDPGTRQSMPLFNLAWKDSFFWDGRAKTLREQVLEPVQNPVEMHATLPQVVESISSTPRYPRMFSAAFGSPEVTPDRISRALEQFLLTIVSHRSKYDRVMAGRAAFTPEERSGAELFHTEYDPARGLRGADCFHCHGGPLFQSTAFANNGLDEVSLDGGRHIATGAEGDRGKFAVPSLRNVALTPPYMHDGRFRTLEEVIDHYDHGIRPSPNLDPNLAKHPDGGLHLKEEEKRALVAFLRTLTDPGFRNTPPPPPPPPRRP